MKSLFGRYPFRNWLADRLCRAAAWLRRETWYVSDNWAGVPGNRAAELEQRIWECVLYEFDSSRNEWGHLDQLQRDLGELAQAAGAAWGHVDRKQKRKFPIPVAPMPKEEK